MVPVQAKYPLTNSGACVALLRDYRAQAVFPSSDEPAQDYSETDLKKREEEMRGDARAEYGAGVIKKLSKELTSIYGKGFEQ